MKQITTKPSTLLRTLEGQQAESSRLRRELSDKATPDELIDAAGMLMAPFPHLKPADAKGYVKTMVAHLSKYPRLVLKQIVDPRTGVVTLCTYPPVIAEVEKFAKPIWDRMVRELQLADTTVQQLAPKPEVSEEDQAQIATGLRALAKNLGGTLEMEKASRPRPRANQCPSGDAIRAKMSTETNPE